MNHELITKSKITHQPLKKHSKNTQNTNKLHYSLQAFSMAPATFILLE